MTEEKEIYSVIFYSQIYKTTEFNYDMHNKEFLIVFKAFYMWYHYLEELKLSIDVTTDNKNLEYFLTIKILSYH